MTYTLDKSLGEADDVVSIRTNSLLFPHYMLLSVGP